MKYAAYYYMILISESVRQRTVNGGNLYCIDYTPRPADYTPRHAELRAISYSLPQFYFISNFKTRPD